jgi:hypothetical protein
MAIMLFYQKEADMSMAGELLEIAKTGGDRQRGQNPRLASHLFYSVVRTQVFRCQALV